MDRDSITALVPIVLLLITIAGFVIWIRLFVQRGLSRLRNWASENGLQIVCVYKKGWTPAGPFRGWNSRDQAIYFLRVRNREGIERDCWVRCRIWFGDQVYVRWIQQ